jgi:hypothetical protein
VLDGCGNNTTELDPARYLEIIEPWQVAGCNHTSLNEGVRMIASCVRGRSMWLSFVLLAPRTMPIAQSRESFI